MLSQCAILVTIWPSASLKATISIAFNEVQSLDLDKVGPVGPMECDNDSIM
jgi:hypothetical protein